MKKIESESSFSFLEIPFKNKSNINKNKEYYKKLVNDSDDKIKYNFKNNKENIIHEDTNQDEIQENINSKIVSQNDIYDPIFLGYEIGIPFLFKRYLKKQKLNFNFKYVNKNSIIISDSSKIIKEFPVIYYKEIHENENVIENVLETNLNDKLSGKDNSNIYYNKLIFDNDINSIIIFKKNNYVKKLKKLENQKYLESIREGKKYKPEKINLKEYKLQIKYRLNFYYMENLNDLEMIIKSVIKKSSYVPKVKIARSGSEFVYRFLQNIYGVGKNTAKLISEKIESLSGLNVTNYEIGNDIMKKIKNILNCKDPNKNIRMI